MGHIAQTKSESQYDNRSGDNGDRTARQRLARKPQASIR